MNNAPTNATDPSGYLEVDDNPNDPAVKNLKDVSEIVQNLVTTVVKKALTDFPKDAAKGIDYIYSQLGKAVGFTKTHSKIGADLETSLKGMQENKPIGQFIVIKQLSDTRYKNVKIQENINLIEASGLVKAPNAKDLKEVPLAYQSSDFATRMLSPVIMMSDVPFGLDKLEHFFEEGYFYFQIWREDNKNLGLLQGYGKYLEGDQEFLKTASKEDLAKFKTWAAKGPDKNLLGISQNLLGGKPGVYGFASSGVVSNADLVANDSGFQFYKSLWDSWNTLDAGKYSFKLSDFVPNLWKLNEWRGNPNTFHPYVDKDVIKP